MLEDGVTLVVHHEPPDGAAVLIARARASAPAAFSAPAPCVSSSYATSPLFRTCSDEYCRIALTALGVSDGPFGFASVFASRSSATVPLATPVAMLVPLNRR